MEEIKKENSINDEDKIVHDEKQDMYGEREIEIVDNKRAVKMTELEKENSKTDMLLAKTELQATRLNLKEAELKLDKKMATNSARLYLKNEEHKLKLSQKLIDEYESYGDDVKDEFFDKYNLSKELFDIEIEKANMDFTRINIEKTKYAIEIGQPEDKARSDMSQLNKALRRQEQNYRIYKKRVDTGFMFIV